MLILGIESSCDETAASVVRDGTEILSSAVASQDTLHGKYGGVVPELASRRHIEAVIPVIRKALRDAKSDLSKIDAIAVTKGPGLVGSLLIGLCAAKSISYKMNIPIVGVNHLHAHLSAILLEERRPSYPCVGLIVSGGHTSLYRLDSPVSLNLLGKTRDDAAGEAFDKVAKLLKLGYPGGIQIEKISASVKSSEITFPRPLPGPNLDFSFSGLKTAVMNLVRETGMEELDCDFKKKVAYSFQEAAVDVLTSKLVRALDKTGLKSAVICGGVAANQRLREVADRTLSAKGMTLFIPRKSLCTDNAAMVAAAGYLNLKAGITDGLSLNAGANLETTETAPST